MRSVGLENVVTIVEVLPDNLRRHLVRARSLYVRIKEHLDGKANSRTSFAMGRHGIHGHTGEDFEVRVKFWVSNLKVPHRGTGAVLHPHQRHQAKLRGRVPLYKAGAQVSN